MGLDASHAQPQPGDIRAQPADAFTGRVILITGGCGGIGAACARWFVARGAQVILADLDSSACAQTARVTGASGGVRLDVTNEREVSTVLAAVRAECGPLSVLVNAAGVVGSGGVEAMAAAQWRSVLETNLTGTFLVCQAAISQLREFGSGKIVNLSSVNARTGGNELSGAAYAASKAGIEALTRHLAVALAPQVQVNAVAPGPVRTPMLARLDQPVLAELARKIPAGRLASPEEVAGAVGFLASPDADFITGITLQQNGGQWLG
jgi:NAD(P)-dependent dehydrogenase (short-subunit alcohol dehydrogenase family)